MDFALAQQTIERNEREAHRLANKEADERRILAEKEKDEAEQHLILAEKEKKEEDEEARLLAEKQLTN